MGEDGGDVEATLLVVEGRDGRREVSFGVRDTAIATIAMYSGGAAESRGRRGSQAPAARHVEPEKNVFRVLRDAPGT